MILTEQIVSFVVSYLLGSVLIPLQVFFTGLVVLLAVGLYRPRDAELIASLRYRLGLSSTVIPSDFSQHANRASTISHGDELRSAAPSPPCCMHTTMFMTCVTRRVYLTRGYSSGFSRRSCKQFSTPTGSSAYLRYISYDSCMLTCRQEANDVDHKVQSHRNIVPEMLVVDHNGRRRKTVGRHQDCGHDSGFGRTDRDDDAGRSYA